MHIYDSSLGTFALWDKCSGHVISLGEFGKCCIGVTVQDSNYAKGLNGYVSI